VTPDQVRAWTEPWPAGILRVGVFVDATPEEAGRAADRARLDVLQLHRPGDPAPFRTAGRRVWQVRRLDGGAPDAIGVAAPDAYVVDSATAARPGGTGVAVDWDRAAEYVRAADRPVVLAGGLTPGNVAEAVRRIAPWGVDVSTGVESAPGRKDPGKVAEFIRQCRSL